MTNNNNQGTGFCPYDYTNVSVVSDSTNSILTTIQVPGGACAAVYDPARGEIFVSSTNANLVSIINDTNNSIVAKIPWGLGPMGLAYDPQLGEVFVAVTGSKSVEAISDSTNSVVGAVFLPNGLYRPEPWFVTYDNAKREVFATDGRDSTISVIDASTLTVNATVTDTGWPEQITYDPIRGEALETDNQNSGMSTVNDTTNGWTNWGGDLGPGSDPTGVIYVDGCHCSFVSARAANKVAELDDATGLVVHYVPVGVSPEGLIYDSGRQEIFAATESSNNVSVISVPSPLPPALASVSVSPSTATLSAGSSQSFTASPVCTGGPCPSGTIYSWSMNGALGSLNSTTGSVVRFTAGLTAGNTYLFVNATLIGITVQSVAVPITVTSGGTSHYAVVFTIHPTTCAIDFNGTSQSNASTGSYLAGTYAILANPCTNFAFHQWNASGGVTVQRPTSSGGFANVTGGGALTAYYVWSGRPLGTGNVTFAISPPSCGPVLFGGINENSGSTIQFTRGNYSADALVCAGYAFSKWSATGSLTLPTLGGNPTTVGVWGNGTLTATYTWVPPPPRYTISFQVAPSTCSPMSFNGSNKATGSSATFLGGRYTIHALPCTGETFSQTTYQIRTGLSQAFLNPWGNVSVSTNGTLWVNYTASSTPLSLALIPVASSVNAGQSVTLTPSVTGGSSPYTCLWAKNGTNTSQVGCTSASFLFMHPGNYTYRVWVTDSVSQIAESNTVTVTVTALSLPSRFVAFENASAPNTIVSEPCSGPQNFMNETLTGSAHGGRPPYTFWWNFGDGNPRVEGQNVSHAYGPGFYRAELSVLDAQGRNASTNLTITISSTTQACAAVSTEPSYLWVFIVAAVALFAAVVAVFLLRRRRTD